MSLQVWLPLTGHLNNQGLSNVTVTNNGATVDNNGKIGKCYYLNGNYIVGTYDATGDITFCMWIYMPTVKTAHVLDARSDSGGYQPMYITPSFIQIGNGNSYPYYSYSFSANTWYHIVVKHDSTGGYCYINGSLIGSTAACTSVNVGTRNFYIATRYNQDTYSNVKVNDFRIYNHSLSEKEIKELSKGLILHYPLTQGSTNLYDFESTTSKWLTDGGVTLANATDANYGNVVKVTVGSSLTGSHRAYRNVSNIWKNNQVYTVSFLAKASKAADCTMSRSTVAGNFTKHFTLTTEWKRYVGQITCTDTVDTGTLSLQVNTTSCDVYFTQVKLEYGDIATPYTPGDGDSHYSAMGYDSTTEYDVSGLLYNGVTTGAALTYNSDTPRYNVCSHFVGTNYIYLTSPSAEAVSISLWVKWDSIPSGQSVVFMDYKSRIGFGLTLTGILCGSVSGSYYTFSKANIQANKWYHFVIVSPNGATNTTRKLYINGVEQTATSNISSWSYTVDQLQIGKRSTTSDGFVGCISDFRMYATALSADDVKQLYNTAAVLCNNGTLMAYSFNEV